VARRDFFVDGLRWFSKGDDACLMSTKKRASLTREAAGNNGCLPPKSWASLEVT